MPSLGDNALDILIKTTSDNRGIAETETALAGLGEKGKAFASSMGDHLKSFGDKIGAAGRSISVLSLPIDLVGLSAIKLASNFDQSMLLVRTQAGASQEEVDTLRDKVLALAPAVGIGPEELAKGLFFVESAGIRGAAAMDVLKLAAEGAKIGQTDLASTANALTSVLDTHVRGASNATEAMGTLNAIVGAGKMHFEDLNAAIGTGFLGTAKMFGVSLDSAGAALAELTRQGEPAQQAATRLGMSMTLMGAPTAKAASILSDIGISAEEIKTSSDAMNEALKRSGVTTNQLAIDMQKPDGLKVALQDMYDHLKKSGVTSEESAAIIARAFGGGRTSKPIMQLIQDLTGLDGTFNQIQKSSGNFAEAWKAQQAQSKQKFDQAWASVKVDLIKLGEDLLPKVARALEEGSKLLEKFMGWWTKLSPEAKRNIEYIAAAIGVGGPLLVAISGVVGAVGTIATAFIGMGGFAITAIAGISKVVIGLFTLISGGTIMGGIATAGALADIALVALAIKKVMDALDAMNNAKKAAAQLGDSNRSILQTLHSQTLAPFSPEVQKRARDTIAALAASGQFNALAGGTNYAKGGVTLVGEEGPELVNLPTGSQVKTASQTRDIMNGGGKGGATIYQTNNIYNQIDMDAANRQLGWRLANA